MDDQPRKLQFSLRNSLVATAWIAAWSANWVWGNSQIDRPSGQFAECVFAAFLVGLPAAAVGALAGRHGLGVACGLASGGASTLWILLV
jgi:hypothetical protein